MHARINELIEDQWLINYPIYPSTLYLAFFSHPSREEPAIAHWGHVIELNGGAAASAAVRMAMHYFLHCHFGQCSNFFRGQLLRSSSIAATTPLHWCDTWEINCTQIREWRRWMSSYTSWWCSLILMCFETWDGHVFIWRTPHAMYSA